MTPHSYIDANGVRLQAPRAPGPGLAFPPVGSYPPAGGGGGTFGFSNSNSIDSHAHAAATAVRPQSVPLGPMTPTLLRQASAPPGDGMGAAADQWFRVNQAGGPGLGLLGRRI